MPDFHFVQNKLAFQTCHGGQPGHPIGGVYFRWQSQDIFIVFALISHHISSQSRSIAVPKFLTTSSILMRVLWPHGKLRCLCTKETAAAGILCILCICFAGHLLTNCKLVKGTFSTYQHRSLRILIRSSTGLPVDSDRWALFQNFTNAIFWFIVQWYKTKQAWFWIICSGLWLKSSLAKKEIVWCQDGNVDMGVICANHIRVTWSESLTLNHINWIFFIQP